MIQETGTRIDAIEEAACTNAEIRDSIHNRLNNFQLEFEKYSERELQKRHFMQSKLEGIRNTRLTNESNACRA